MVKAYERTYCLRDLKSNFIKAGELRDRDCVVRCDNESRVVRTLVKPSSLKIDEFGCCEFGKVCTDLLFHVLERCYEKEDTIIIILTSSVVAREWTKSFIGDDTQF